jgi:ankyrin repeat protein
LPGRASKQTWQPLHVAACFGSPETIEVLIRHHARVNAKDSTGLTPLHYTIPLSRYDSAAMLINKGADVNIKGRDGNSPLDLAKNLRDQRMVELLRIRGAKE